MQLSGKKRRLILLGTVFFMTTLWVDAASAAKSRNPSSDHPATTHMNRGSAREATRVHLPAASGQLKMGMLHVSSRLLISGSALGKHSSGRAFTHTGARLGLTSRKLLKGGKMRYAAFSSGISCVPFARAASGIDLKGNAGNWWDAAEGVYERGSQPQPGSILSFRATGRMRLGHVAVVAAVVNGREVEIDHANWAGPGVSKGNVSRGVSVVDVSDSNDWSEVRVALGRSGDYGSVYPTYGFIYDRPDRGVMLANATRRPILLGRTQTYDEVAEAPAFRGGRQAGFIDAPSRAIR